MKLPEQFINNMRVLLGEEYEKYERALEGERLFGLRVNTLKISCEEFERIAPFEIRKIPYIKNGYFYDGDAVQPAKHPYYFAGLYYLQDPSAMTPASRLPVKPGMRVLDLCAAPGGKSTELAARLAGEGILVANDISAKRAKALQKNIELFGVTNSLITTEYPDKLAGYFPSFFDCILIDAPCSGEGMFRKDPAMIKAWTPESNSQYAAMQEDIVKAALRMLKPGGYLLYSTCTFSPMEDEETVCKMLQMDPSLRVVDMEGYEGFAPGRPDMIEKKIRDLIGQNKNSSEDTDDRTDNIDESSIIEQIRKCVRIYPHRMDGEGHFLALLYRNKDDLADDSMRESTDGSYINSIVDGSVYQHDKKKKNNRSNNVGCDIKSSKSKSKNINGYGINGKPSKEEREIWEEFAGGISREFDISRIESHDGMLYYGVEGLPDVRGLKFIRSGLFLGECKKKRFEPSQTLAMAIKSDEYDNVINLPHNDGNIIRYLKGETLSIQSMESVKPGAVSHGSSKETDIRAEGSDSPVDVRDGTVLICVDGYPLGWGKKTGHTVKNKYHPGWRLM